LIEENELAMSSPIERMTQAVVEGDVAHIAFIVQDSLNQGISPQEILDRGLIPGMDEIGRLFSSGEIFLPEMMVAAKAMQTALHTLRPYMVKGGVKPLGRMAIGTVKDDLHDIGKNIVISVMQGGGMEMIDLGVDVPPEKFVEAVKEGDIQLLGLSAVLTTVLPNIKKTIDTLNKAGVRHKVKILIGGVAVNNRVVQEMGGDVYCQDAAEGLRKAKELLGISKPS
jgi:5-methyltetrahydrofolate--homocysteine methyltransferase